MIADLLDDNKELHSIDENVKNILEAGFDRNSTRAQADNGSDDQDGSQIQEGEEDEDDCEELGHGVAAETARGSLLSLPRDKQEPQPDRPTKRHRLEQRPGQRESQPQQHQKQPGHGRYNSNAPMLDRDAYTSNHQPYMGPFGAVGPVSGLSGIPGGHNSAHGFSERGSGNPGGYNNDHSLPGGHNDGRGLPESYNNSYCAYGSGYPPLQPPSFYSHVFHQAIPQPNHPGMIQYPYQTMGQYPYQAMTLLQAHLMWTFKTRSIADSHLRTSRDGPESSESPFPVRMSSISRKTNPKDQPTTLVSRIEMKMKTSSSTTSGARSLFPANEQMARVGRLVAVNPW